MLDGLMENALHDLRVQALRQQFAAEGVNIRLEDQVILIEVENEFGRAVMSPFGATVMQYQPAGQAPVLWQSPTAVFDGKKPIRAGIPVCWPWFGKAKVEGKPAHGFVRNRDWQIASIETLPQGTKVVFAMESDEQTLEIWPVEFRVELAITVGAQLTVELITHNRSEETIEITEALHTYFTVSDVNTVVVEGLAGSETINTLQQPLEKQAVCGALDVQAPMDSVYVNQTGSSQIIDKALGRVITIAKAESASAVVWNPGPETVKGFADIPHELWPNFLCVEAGNVWDNAVQIPSNSSHTMTMVLSSQSL